ncbi:MAG: endonuclease/exonuclease/phosphatase family protein [Myxococcales bacterium]|nr:endonuclease/exonuclease/phosphatase family protein [Myxococcales bacterium]
MLTRALMIAALIAACTPPADDPASTARVAPAYEAGWPFAPIDAAPPDAAPDAAPDAEPDAETGDWPTPRAVFTTPGYLQIGTFNIDWLGARFESEFTPRNAVDYAMIARLLVEWDIDVLALQEIEGAAALDLLGLPRHWRAVVGRSGWSQNPAILYRSDRVTLGEPREIHLPDTTASSKDPLVVEVTPLEGGPMFTLVVVHLHPYGDAESTAYRAAQVAHLHQWLDDGLPGAPPPRWPVVLAGDFNDSIEGIRRGQTALGPLIDDPRLTFIEDECPDPTELHFNSRIDHVIASAELAPVLRPPPGEPACTVIHFDETSPYADYPGGYRDRQTISTHRPVFAWMRSIMPN